MSGRKSTKRKKKNAMREWPKNNNKKWKRERKK